MQTPYSDEIAYYITESERGCVGIVPAGGGVMRNEILSHFTFDPGRHPYKILS